MDRWTTLLVILLLFVAFAAGTLAGYEWGRDHGRLEEQQRAEDAGAGRFERDERTGRREFRYKDRRILPWVP